MIRKLFDDPSGGIINQRYFLSLVNTFQYLDIDERDKKDLFSLFMLICIKLASIWKHKTNYFKLEDDLIIKAKAKPIIAGKIDNQIQCSQDMFIEFDEFLVQTKSCLDHLVKLPAIIFGRQCWQLRTFRESGRDVIKSFENNTPAQYKKFVPCVVELINKHQEWFEDIIEARNRINHFVDGGINFNNFIVAFQKTKDSEELIVPKWSDEQTVRNLIEIIWGNMFHFVEDFSMYLLSMRLKSEHNLCRVPLPAGSKPIESPWKLNLYSTIKKSFDEWIAKQQ